MSIEVSIDLSQFDRYVKELSTTLAYGQSGPLRSGFDTAGKVILNFERKRFIRDSKGGGDWPDLAIGTKVARMRQGSTRGEAKGGALKAPYARYRRELAAANGRPVTKRELAESRHFDILRDTGLLLNSLSAGGIDNVLEPLPDGIRLGTAVKYAAYHQSGGRHLPQREVIVQPDSATIDAVGKILGRAVEATIKNA